MIELNKVSTESNFIKNLLYSTFLPRLRTVRENDFIIKDRLYIHKCNIIRCTNSGYIVAKNAILDTNLYPKTTLRKTDDEKVKVGQIYYVFDKEGRPKEIIGTANDERSPLAEGWFEQNIATYIILGEYYFGERNDKFCSNFLSSSEGYDYKTHEELGHYLRSLRDMYGLNLLPLYNCFSNQLLKNIHIGKDKVEKTAKDYSTKVYKVPIRFNTDYTICMNNVGMTTFAPAFIRHGTLLRLNNNRFGNFVDATNKYIKLNHGDVIHNKPNLRFNAPIKLRFDNIPQNKVIRYSEYVFTKIPAEYNTDFYKLSLSASPAYTKTYVENEAYLTYSYTVQDKDIVIHEGEPNILPGGYRFMLEDPDNGLHPSDDLFPEEYDPSYEGPNPEDYPFVLPYVETYESLNPSIGTFDDIYDSFRKCPEDETFFNVNIFNSNKTRYYYIDDGDFIQCTNASVYDPETIYYYKNIDFDLCWYEINDDGEFVPTEDTYIKYTYYRCSDDFNKAKFNENRTNYYYYDESEDDYIRCTESSEYDPETVYYYKAAKNYYKKEKTEIITTYNYDITEENCCMYDYIEDELYLLIQVPSVFDTDIVILEGDYTNTDIKEKIYDKSNYQLFTNNRLDYLFTKNLILMESSTKRIIPFSNTLIQFLLWHVICNLDTVNGDMDRLVRDLDRAGVMSSRSRGNYWHSRYRQIVYDYADLFPKKYIRDNLGYVTTEIERIIATGKSYFDDGVFIENSYLEQYETSEEI